MGRAVHIIQTVHSLSRFLVIDQVLELQDQWWL